MIIGIFGTGRNGSSLLTRLLDGLVSTYVHPVEESFATVFDEIARHRPVGRLVTQNCTTKSLRSSTARADAEPLRKFYARNIESLERDYIKRCQQLSDVRHVNSQSVLPKESYFLPELVSEYLGSLARCVRPDAPAAHYAFKSIETPYIADYARAIPGMRFIHIIRDPIAVCSSQKRSLLENKKLPASYLGYDWLTCMMEKRWIPHAKFISNPNVGNAHLVVRYEDLVVAPHQEIARISTWLGLHPPPRPDTQTVFGNLDMDSWGFNPSKKGVATPTSVVANLQAINQYDEILTKREIDLINTRSAPYLKLLGYDKRPVLRRFALLRENLMPDKWDTMHCTGVRSWGRAIIGMAYRRFYIAFWR